MIKRDQPTIFGSAVIAAVSSKSDGDMSFGRATDEQIVQNRKVFLDHIGIDSHHTTLVRIGYEAAEHFARYHIATDEHKTEGMLKQATDVLADALVVTQPGHALFLPIADCVGVILYDQVRSILMVSHVGRHSIEIDGAKKSVKYLENMLGVDPKNLKVWLSPAVGKAAYPLRKKQNRGLHEVILEQLAVAGVVKENIEVSQIDTAIDEEYFSHSQFLMGNRELDGRFAIVAMMTAQGEPASSL